MVKLIIGQSWQAEAKSEETKQFISHKFNEGNLYIELKFYQI